MLTPNSVGVRQLPVTSSDSQLSGPESNFPCFERTLAHSNDHPTYLLPRWLKQTEENPSALPSLDWPSPSSLYSRLQQLESTNCTRSEELLFLPPPPNQPLALKSGLCAVPLVAPRVTEMSCNCIITECSGLRYS